MPRLENLHPFFAPDDISSGSSSKESPQEGEISILERIFQEAGMTPSEPENPHESQFKRTGGIDGDDIGTEVFLWNTGRPVVHIRREMYLKPKEDGMTYQAEWLMDPDDNGVLHHLNLRTFPDRNLIAVGMQHPSDPDRALEVEYLHGHRDGAALLGETKISPTDTLSPTIEGSPTIKYFEYNERVEKRVVVEGLQGEVVRESVVFPHMLTNVPELIMQLEGTWKDIVTDPAQPWKTLLKDFGITYAPHSQ